MGKVRKRGAAPGAPVEECFEAGGMEDRWRRRRDAHPPRGYAGQRLERVKKKTNGMPRNTSAQFAGGTWARRRKRDSGSSAAGGASGASTGRVVTAEFLGAPYARRTERGGRRRGGNRKSYDLNMYDLTACYLPSASCQPWMQREC